MISNESPIACADAEQAVQLARFGPLDGELNGFRAIDDRKRRRAAIGRWRQPSFDFLDNAGRVLGTGIVGCDHDDVAESRGHCAHQRPLRAIAVASASEHRDDAALRERPRGLEKVLQGVIGVRVIDHHSDVIGAARHQLEASGHVDQTREALLYRRRGYVECGRGGDSRKNV